MLFKRIRVYAHTDPCWNGRMARDSSSCHRSTCQMADSKLTHPEERTEPRSKRTRYGPGPGSGPTESLETAVVRICLERPCKLCGERDDSWDPLAKAQGIPHDVTVAEACRAWGYPIPPSGKTEGWFCWYCTRVWGGKYRLRGYTMTSLVAFLGGDEKEFKAFIQYVRCVEGWVCQQGTRRSDMPWDAFGKKVLHYQEESVCRFRKPDDEYWTLDYYRHQKGDPTTNGLNHKQVHRDGMDFVIIPGSFSETRLSRGGGGECGWTVLPTIRCCPPYIFKVSMLCFTLGKSMFAGENVI